LSFLDIIYNVFVGLTSHKSKQTSLDFFQVTIDHIFFISILNGDFLAMCLTELSSIILFWVEIPYA
ncbi:hypothetical protein H5410_030834, partial [Solanum commersonii]